MEEDYVMIPGSGTKKIIRDVKKEIETAFLDYSMSVIVSRALPDVRDGLKPVHRRILYTMHERGNDPSHPYRKSADTVGAVKLLVFFPDYHAGRFLFNDVQQQLVNKGL